MQELLQHTIDLWLSNPIGQTLGFCASLSYFIAATQKDDKKLFGFMFCGTIFWLLHYGSLGAWVASIGFAVGAVRNAIAYFKLATPARRLWITFSLIAAYVLIGICSGKEIYDALPVIGSSLYVVASYNLSGIKMRGHSLSHNWHI